MIFGNNKQADQTHKLNSGHTGADAVFDVGVADFEQAVIMASMEKPVIVDFWAPWCGPCKQLGPVLEKVVRENEGFVSMAKVNLDDNQELAAALRVQSVPTVYAFFQGQPVDGFQGALPESRIREFVGKLVTMVKAAQPGAIDIPESLTMAAQALADGDLQTAQMVYAQVLQMDEQNVPAYVGMVRVFIAAGKLDKAQDLIDNAPAEISKASGFGEAMSALELAQTGPVGSLDSFVAAVEKNPKDHDARIELAKGLFASGKKMEGVEALLESIRLDRAWNEDAARKELLKFFEAMGHADPVTVEGRKKLSSILFS